MSSREKRLLIFFAVAGFILLNVFAFRFFQSFSGDIDRKHRAAKLQLETAAMTQNASAQIADEMEWLNERQPEPITNPDAQSRLEQLVAREARTVGLSSQPIKLLPSDTASAHYHRAKLQITVTGNEEALYRWLDRVNQPDQFRIATQLRLSPNKKDDTNIDCTATIEQWFVPEPPTT